MTADPIQLIPTKSDADLAAEIKKEVRAKILDICKVLDDARDKGFVINFGLGLDAFNHQIITTLTVAKHY